MTTEEAILELPLVHQTFVMCKFSCVNRKRTREKKEMTVSEREPMIEDVLDGTREVRAALVLRDDQSTPHFWCLQTRFNADYDNDYSP